MKSVLAAKFLQTLNRKKKDGGFTLIELLVVIIIIGILSAIALPAFLNQANKAKQSEAKTNVGSLNRAQQARYMEKGMFAGSSDADFGALGLGIKKATNNYTFSIKDGGGTPANGTVAATVTTFVTNQAQPNQNAIKAYIGGVQQGNVSATSEATTLVVLCEAKLPKGSPGSGVATGLEQHNSGGAEPACHTNYDPL